MDNPCWGGAEPSKHNLPHLLHRIQSGYFDVPTSNAPTTPPTNPSSSSIPPTNTNTLKRPLILYEDANYIALNKPPDLRMDGTHLATVHKLLTYWYPPPSLLLLHTSTSSSSSDPFQSQSSLLLTIVSSLSKHNCVVDNTLRPTHQLDYATSGILLVARSRKAAGRACRAFQERTVRKEYLAVVDGHFGDDECHGGDASNGILSHIPILDESQTRLWKQWMNGSFEMEQRRDKRRKEKKARKGKRGLDGVGGVEETFVGFLPIHAVFAKWKGLRLRLKKTPTWTKGSSSSTTISTEGGDKEEQRETGVGNPIDQMLLDSNPIPNHNNTTSCSKDSIQDHLLSSHWRDIKTDASLYAFFEDLAGRYNRLLRTNASNHIPNQTLDRTERMTEGIGSSVVVPSTTTTTTTHNHPTTTSMSSSSNSNSNATTTTLPTIFRVNDPSSPPSAIYIHAPLAEVPNEFRVVIDRDVICGLSEEVRGRYGRSYSSTNTNTDTEPSTDTELNGTRLEFRPALTQCTVVKRGVWNGRPVTKVLLRPLTGRRHQLRVHMAICGHPILGDATYNDRATVPTDDSKELPITTTTTTTTTTTNTTRCTDEGIRRMCLHAHKLTIPWSTGNTNDGKTTEKKTTTTFVAPDPFRWKRRHDKEGDDAWELVV